MDEKQGTRDPFYFSTERYQIFCTYVNAKVRHT